MPNERVETLGYEARADRATRRRRPRPPRSLLVVRRARFGLAAVAFAGEYYLSTRGALDGPRLGWAMLVTIALLVGTGARVVVDLLTRR